jgi:two-component system sensor histidine kinase KdpD
VNRVRAITIYRIAIAGLSLGAIVEIYRLFALTSPTIVALTLLLFILLLAARWGLRFAVFASIAAAACLNYFFLPPTGTFTIADNRNWVALFAFWVAAIIASQLSNRIQTEARQAKARERELAMLFELSRALLQTDKVAELMEAIPGCVSSATRASDVIFYLDRGSQVFHSINVTPDQLRSIDIPAAMQSMDVHTCVEDGWTILPVRTGIRPRGVLLIRGISASRETCESLARLISIGIDRAEALEEAARSEAAKESERLRMILLDSITHELRTPLTAIKASATTLLSSGQVSTDDQHDMLTVIDEEADRLNALIAQAVQMGQLEANDMRMQLAPCPVADLIQRSVQSCALSLSEHHLQISIRESCPDVIADGEWMEHAIANLLRNAAKYSPKGSTILVTAQPLDHCVSLSVADEGPGIDPDEKDMIFDRFYRGQRFRGRVSGTGLGLAICRAVVTAHHGTIDVQNQTGHGARFSVTLPAA